MEKDKFYYIKVNEYIKDSIHNDFYPIGYFSDIEAYLNEGVHAYIEYIVCTVSDKSVAKRYKYKRWAEKKVEEIFNLTKNFKSYYPYDESTYKYIFEIVEE